MDTTTAHSRPWRAEDLRRPPKPYKPGYKYVWSHDYYPPGPHESIGWWVEIPLHKKDTSPLSKAIWTIILAITTIAMIALGIATFFTPAFPVGLFFLMCGFNAAKEIKKIWTKRSTRPRA